MEGSFDVLGSINGSTFKMSGSIASSCSTTKSTSERAVLNIEMEGNTKMENDYSSDDEEHLPGGMQSDISESEATSEGSEDEEEELSELEENGDEAFDEGDEIREDGADKMDESGGEEGDAEGDAGEEGDKDMRGDGPEKPRKKALKRRKSKVKGDSAQPKAKKKRKGKEPLIKKRRNSKPKHLRRDIKTLMKESELEAQTLAAQREEEERRKRLEEQRAQNTTPPGLLTQLLETKTSELIAEQKRNIAESNDYILLESSSGEEDKKQLSTSNQKPKPDIIEILSSDEDVKVLSEGEKDEHSDLEYGIPGQEEESGTHTDDFRNCPDSQGRVLVNVNHPVDEQDIFLPPHLAEKVKPHQIGGIRFLYDNLVESLKRFASSPGFGCILAHSMGLGKTLQVICFSDIVLRYTAAKRVLCIVPINTLQNWIAEYDMWLPKEGDPVTGREGRQFGLFVLNDTHKTTVARAKVIEEWYRSGGVMLMGYEIYRLLCNRRFTGKPKKRKKKSSADPEVIDLEEEERIEKGLSNIRSAICDPGPDLVVCDEGHRIKNSLAGISKALKNIKTRRRVVLTGYPLQNNLMEYWCMVDFVRPSYLGTKHEFSNLFERPIQNGQCIDSTPVDIKLMRYRAHVLHNKLEGFVQRRGFKVLTESLPQKKEHVILVRLTQFQKGLYCKFMQCFKDAGAGGWCSTNPLKAFAVGCKIWNHPDILYEVLQQRETDVDTDLDIPELSSKTGLKKQAPNSLGTTTASGSGTPTSASDAVPKSNGIRSFEEKMENMSYQEKVNQILSFEWARENMRNYSQRKLSNGGKMVLLFHIIEESIKHGDKILVFSQSLMTLSLIEKFLSLRKIPDPPDKPVDMCQDWIRNVTYFRLDGSTAGTERERMINQFNKPDNHTSWLFLLSTRAGCLGVNLIGANRVVVLDASWNPCHDAQAVCRVYRYGQKKTCHIYRMVTDNTLEKKIYDRQISKKGMSDRVVDELNPQMNLTKREVESLLEFDDSDMPFEDFSHLADNFDDPILRSICLDHSQTICKAPFSTESLLWDRKDQRLTRAEKAQARKSYEDELRLNSSYNRPSYAAYYPKSEKYGSVPPLPSASGSYETSLPYLLNMRGQIEMPKKPIASVRPLQSTPVPKYPPNPGISLNKPLNQGLGDFSSLKGLSVQKLVATTDIILPGGNSLTNTTAKISAGETVTFIKTQRGIYLRTPEGRFIAVRGPSNKDSNQQSVPRSLSEDSISLDSSRDSPRSVNSSADCLSSSVVQSTGAQTITTQASFGPTCSIPQLSSISRENSPAMSLMNSVISNTETVNQSAIATSSGLTPIVQTSIPQGMPPFMFNQPFPIMTTHTGTFYPQQLPINFSLSSVPPSTSYMTSSSSARGTNELPDLFLPQTKGLSLGNAVHQQNFLPQGNVLPPQSSALLQESGIASNVSFSSPSTTHQNSTESSSSPQPPVKFTSEPSVLQQDDGAPFLGGSPQLPNLDASSVEEILNGTSASNPKQSAADVQSSNLASLSQFVSSSFPTS